MTTVAAATALHFSNGLSYADRRSPAPTAPPFAGRRFIVAAEGANGAADGHNEGSKVPIKSIYRPTPPDRELRTPHSGYHFDGTTRLFFEGWYFKVSIPKERQSFCFMYSVENPAFHGPLGKLDEAVHGPRFTGVGAQILGADDKYICQYSNESKDFWGSRHELCLGNTFKAREESKPPNREVPPEEFNDRVFEGFQVTPIWHQGCIHDDGRSNYVETVKTARWEYSTRPVYGWGDVNSTQKSSAGWLAAFPVFEPHWQICMAGGLSTGWIEWDGRRFEFENAPSYSEKNWGGGFPRKWFWVQCNAFEGASGEVALTCGGGLRKLSGLLDNYESVALIGVHFGGIFYEFVPWTGTVSWEITQWGYWKVSADNETHMVEVEAMTREPGTPLRAPTMEDGFVVACKDTCLADLKLQIWEKINGSKGKRILDVTSNMAAVEVGGGPWYSTWKAAAYTPELIKKAVGLPIDVEKLVLLPFLKPAGL